MRESAVGETVVDLRGREKAEAAVMMARVVPVEKESTEAQPVLLRAEAVRKFRSVLHRLELALAEGIVVRYVRTAVRLRDTQVAEQLREQLALHRGTVVRVQVK